MGYHPSVRDRPGEQGNEPEPSGRARARPAEELLTRSGAVGHRITVDGARNAAVGRTQRTAGTARPHRLRRVPPEHQRGPSQDADNLVPLVDGPVQKIHDSGVWPAS
ncbi:hypothetical protein FMEAI12_4280042 [Parafrankia sp. Ea1.12]|nr:hypothetical protein FMEAI12_4280042 [Parafrankia sp. Ea1.12]